MKIINIQKINKFYPHIANNKQRVKSMLKILTNRKDLGGNQVLKDISFEVNSGESLAIIGRNGAGKSTLLKIISGVIQATSGNFIVNGSIGALLELGSGFDPEYTGIENLKMAAAMNGLIGKEADAKIAKMVEFANIGDYINEPVKSYSSGMVVRLGFSVITETKPDLLITDEVLAVGDESFQLKCLKWIDEYLSSGGTLLLVSHSIYHVQKLCSKALWLEHGEIKALGDVFEVSQAYQESIVDPNVLPSGEVVNRSSYHIHGVEIKCRGSECDEIEFGSDVLLKVKVFSPDGAIPGICMGIATQSDQPVYGTYSELHQANPYVDSDGFIIYEIELPNLKLLPGLYDFKLHTMTPDNIQMIDAFYHGFRVKGKTRELGVYQVTTEWK